VRSSDIRFVSVVTSTRSPTATRLRISPSKVVDLPAHGPDFDHRIDQPSGANDLLDDDALRQAELQLARRRGHEDGARRE